MKIIRPVQIGLQSSSIPENDYAAWNSATAYVQGDRVLDAVNHKIYESITGLRNAAAITIGTTFWTMVDADQNPIIPAVGTPVKFTTTGALPTGFVAGTVYYVAATTPTTFTLSATVGGAAISASGSQSGVHALTTQVNINKPLSNKLNWLDAGSSNRWKPFDSSVQSQATATTQMTFTVTASAYVDTVVLLNVKATKATVSMSQGSNGVVFNKVIPLSENDGVVATWLDYFFAGFRTKKDLLIEGLPLYRNTTITVTLDNAVGQQVALGASIFGFSKDISSEKKGAEHGAKVGIQAYDVKKRDDFGNYTIVPRAFAKRADFTVHIRSDEVDSIQDLLAEIRSTPIVYVGSGKYAATMVYGYYKSFDIDIAYYDYSVCSIQLEGLT
jgi:hypothetical protein